MSVNITFNPNDYFDWSGDQSRADTSFIVSEEQRRLDNSFRQQQAWKQDQWAERLFHASQNRLQNLVKDAQAAGISPLAAVGAGGASLPNINLPSGQGGRVQGRYNRQTSMQASISFDMAAKQLTNQDLQNDILKLQRDNMAEDLKAKKQPVVAVPEDMYVRAIDNTAQAKEWFDAGYIPYINPNINMELPESVGGYYWAKPRVIPDEPESYRPKTPLQRVFDAHIP